MPEHEQSKAEHLISQSTHACLACLPNFPCVTTLAGASHHTAPHSPHCDNDDHNRNDDDDDNKEGNHQSRCFRRCFCCWRCFCRFCCCWSRRRGVSVDFQKIIDDRAGLVASRAGEPHRHSGNEDHSTRDSDNLRVSGLRDPESDGEKKDWVGASFNPFCRGQVSLIGVDCGGLYGHCTLRRHSSQPQSSSRIIHSFAFICIHSHSPFTSIAAAAGSQQTGPRERRFEDLSTSSCLPTPTSTSNTTTTTTTTTATT